MARAVALNLTKALLLVAALAAVAGGVGWLIGGLTSALLFAFCSLLAATGVYRYGDRALLGMLGARPFALAEHPTLRPMADTVASKLAVRPPSLYLIPDGFPRLFAVGRGPTSSGLAVSTGALRSLRREELEAAIAHELAHVRRRDVLVQTFVVLFAATLVESSRIGGWFSRVLLYAFAPLSAAFVHLLLSPRRELHADALAASATGGAHDLADALMRLDRASELVEFAASPATEPLYSVDPFESEGIARMFKTHPPLELRVRRLRELGSGQNGRGDASVVELAG
ncbi:MAG: M48 family metalloprotease [Thermoleophilia bacterium]|nr:M48 family metalloprotease [Thermoleophilia bacterium]MDH4340151.1 M48 family metalloprotease [Thermoleophilia bacterium]MDH5281465.1 M48 family metalloprotease [Thermoleophilia bacterium]